MNQPGSEWVERARALAPAVAEWRDAGEQQRHIVRPLVDAIRDAGLFGLAVPRALGGADAGHETILEVIEELSRQDGAVGWNVMIAAQSAVVASYLPEKALREIYGAGPSAVIAGALPPRGTAVPVPGGFRLSGRWGFASGCHHADWLIAPGTIMAGDAPRLRSDGSPDTRVFFVPAAACEILDTWYTAGLRATGSDDFRLADVLVPEQRSFPLVPAGPAAPGALSVAGFLSHIAPSFAAVALGIARDAIDAFKALAVTKTPARGASTLATQPTIQERVGRAEALVGAARSFVYETARGLPLNPSAAGEIGDEWSARVRLASAHAAASAAEAVDLMFTAAGTTSIYATSRLERCFRDVHIVTQHVAVAPSNIEMVGQYLLGQGLQIRR